ncbi:histidine kinase [Embleya sp. NPDC005971]|uniref:sensor histidine kinase n=1 Tax=unclassified Embleya TaxID=2699296 RepID=UPI0033ED456B
MQSAVGLLGFLNLLAGHPTSGRIALYVTAFVLVFALQSLHCALWGSRLRARYGGWTLAAQALLTYGPLCVLGLAWAGMSGFLAGAVLLVLNPPWSVTAFGCATALTGGWVMMIDPRPLGVSIGILSCTVNALMVYGVTRIAAWSVVVRRAREEFSRLAVEGERLRVARDLHDLLGYNLAAITLKCELVTRLIDKEAKGAHAELQEVLAISRQAFADLRCVAHGYRQLSLAVELSAARRVLSTAGIDLAIHDERVPLHEDTGSVLATVVREGVTNVLRHSMARSCRITISRTGGRLVLEMANDGVPTNGGARAPHRLGGGLDNLGRRLDEVGGTFRAGADGDGWFRLTAEHPVEPLRALSLSKPAL